jgi:hypothetical protein
VKWILLIVRPFLPAAAMRIGPFWDQPRSAIGTSVAQIALHQIADVIFDCFVSKGHLACPHALQHKIQKSSHSARCKTAMDYLLCLESFIRSPSKQDDRLPDVGV